MKTQRVVIVVLSLAVIVLGYLAFFSHPKAEVPLANPAETSHSATVELWHTNTVDKWHTNTLEVTVTNTVLQPVTNEVVREVPAKLSTTDKQALLVGYKYLHAPPLENASEALYKSGPFAIDVYADATAASLLDRSSDELRQSIENALRAENIPVAENSSQHLRLNLAPLWRMSDPRVALVSCKLELRQATSVERQGDIVKCEPILWSTTSAKFLRTFNMAEGVDKCVQNAIEKFAKDYREAKEGERQIESRLPKVPTELVSGEN